VLQTQVVQHDLKYLYSWVMLLIDACRWSPTDHSWVVTTLRMKITMHSNQGSCWGWANLRGRQITYLCLSPMPLHGVVGRGGALIEFSGVWAHPLATWLNKHFSVMCQACVSAILYMQNLDAGLTVNTARSKNVFALHGVTAISPSCMQAAG